MIYFVFSVISVLFMIGQASILSMFGNLIFVLLWTWFLNFLCNKNLTGVAWFLVLLPFVLMFLIIVFAADVFFNIAKDSSQGQQQQQQGQHPQQMH
jgi:H+/Cl- antiporter ClcA